MKVNYKKLITLIGGKCWSVRDLVSKANIQPKAYYDIKAGKDKAIGYLVGQVMKRSKGQANPSLAQKLIREKL